MSKDMIRVTKRGERLIATKFGIPYGLFLAIYSRYGLWVILPLLVALSLKLKNLLIDAPINWVVLYSWWAAFMYMHPKERNSN